MGKASRLKKFRRLETTEAARFADSFRQSDLGKNAIVVENLAGEEKMSELLVELARPYLLPEDRFDDIKRSIGLAAIAWNLSLLSEAEREAESTRIVSQLHDSIQPYLQDLVREKENLFPDVKRFILSYEVVPRGEGFHVNVISTPQHLHCAPA